MLGILNTTRSFPKIPEEARSLPKKSEDFRSLSPRINASSLAVLFTSKIRDREEVIVIYSFYTWFSFLAWVGVNIFLEIVSSKTATTHIFQSGVRNWPASVSRREIEVFNPQAWELAGIMYLLTEWEGRTGKYLARGQGVRTERSELRTFWPRAKYFPVRPDLTQSISILSYDPLLLKILKILFKSLLHPFWNHWLSLQCDWFSAVRFIPKSHHFLL